MTPKMTTRDYYSSVNEPNFLGRNVELTDFEKKLTPLLTQIAQHDLPLQSLTYQESSRASQKLASLMGLRAQAPVECRKLLHEKWAYDHTENILFIECLNVASWERYELIANAIV